MIAETLAGIALVKSAVDGIKSAIGTANDIGEIAGHIDKLFEGEKQVQQQRAKKSGAGVADQFGIQSVAQEMMSTFPIPSSIVLTTWQSNISSFKFSQTSFAFSGCRPQTKTFFIGLTLAWARIKLEESAPVPIINTEEASFLDKNEEASAEVAAVRFAVRLFACMVAFIAPVTALSKT